MFNKVAKYYNKINYKMKFTSLAILALLGDEVAVNRAHAMRVTRGELQDPDYYDRSFDQKEAKEMQQS